MEATLEHLSETVASAGTLEELSRPLLEMLQLVTGLESAYLTSIDLDAQLQSITYARNAGELHIPEGLTVPWADTLCKRCLEQGRRVVSNVGEVWGDSQAAAALGIQTYASAPVSSSDGRIIGTLCAASRGSQTLGPRARTALNLFSRLIAQHVEREQLVAELKRSNDYLTRFAMTDSLTELPNRRAFRDELGRLLARSARDGSYVLVGMLDLDGFKQINDEYGHTTGDLLLQQCAGRLAGMARNTDILARIGGDEFAFAGPGPATEEEATKEAEELAAQARAVTAGSYTLRGSRIDYPGASAGVVAVRFVSVGQAIELADAAMYQSKKDRRRLFDTRAESRSAARQPPGGR
ncbi:diguanylate cyclase (plasmid) [Paraburkholderia sp. PREW-6R]|uniref:sensor domain-containing diguanylate cyclase n=1 Tax=Paraburkholderia sp. PREW-6R TaxID=3141544 RepID=UPI0031F5205E